MNRRKQKPSGHIPTYSEFLRFAEQCQIRSGTRLINFSPLFEYQKAIAKLAQHYRGMAIVKDRQLGITEILICWMLCRAASNPAYAGAVFSITEKDAHKVSGRIKRMPGNIPNFTWAIDSVGVRQPVGGGELNFRPSTDNATRGLESVWDLFFDEAGFVPIISEMYAASTPSQEMVGPDARTFIVSTIPLEGTETWFWQQFESASPPTIDAAKMLELARGGGHHNSTAIALPEIPGLVCWEDSAGWAKVAISHKAHPIYGSNPNYVEDVRVKRKLTEEQANREYNLTLPPSGGSLFNLDLAQKYADVLYWEKPRYGRHYLAGIDPNMGGEDYWVMQVWDITTHPYTLAAVWREHLRLPGYCRESCYPILKAYRPVLLAVEKNNGGLAVAEDIQRDLPWLEVEVVNTSKTSKRTFTDKIAIHLTNGDVRYPADWEGLREMRHFTARDRQASPGHHDDEITCWMVAFSLLDKALEKRPTPSTSAGVGGTYPRPFG